MLYCFAPLSLDWFAAVVAAPHEVAPTVPSGVTPPYVPSMSFALEYEARIEPWPTGTASATPYCLALQSLSAVLYLMSSYAKPTSTTPKLKPPFTDQPVSVLPAVVKSLWRSYAAPMRALPPMPAHCTDADHRDGSAIVVAPTAAPVALLSFVW